MTTPSKTRKLDPRDRSAMTARATPPRLRHRRYHASDDDTSKVKARPVTLPHVPFLDDTEDAR